MRTRRPISINNSLVHGICNYSCRLCAVNKANYNGPREFQSYIVTKTLIQRVLESAGSGIHVRYIANSGDGEATLHPEFSDRMRMFGDMLREWDVPGIPSPEVSVVTNGSRLNIPGIMDPFLENKISLIISFPTIKPESYGLIMTGDSGQGDVLLSKVLPGIGKAMALRAEGCISRLYFHISPPETDIIRRDFQETVDHLTLLARKNGLDKISLVLFPAISNRSGLVRSSVASIDTYKDLFKHYNGHTVNGVSISMKLVLKRFFYSIGEIGDLVRSFRFPCLWNANFFIAADGSSICCNDQSVRNPLGNILHDSISTLMRYKEQYMPGRVCAGCNQSPHKLKGSIVAVLYSFAAKIRTLSASLHYRHSVSGDSLSEDNNTLPSENVIIRKSDCRSERVASISEEKKDVISDLKLAESIDEMKEAFRLIYDRYLASGFQVPDPSSMRIGFYNLLPTSNLSVVKRNGKVAGTLTIIRECNGKLPIYEFFGEEIHKIRKKDSRICELSGLATDAALSRRESRGTLLSLFKSTLILGNDILGCSDFFMMINPRHSAFYRKGFNCEQIGQVKYCDKVNGAPAIPLRMNPVTGEEVFQKINPQLYRYFTASDRQKLIERLSHELYNQRKLYCIEYINSLIRSNNNLLKSLTEEEKTILRLYYPEFVEVV